MKVVLLGSGGMLASDLAATVPAHCSLFAATSEEVDVTSRAALRRVIAEQRPHWIINAAAYTNVDGAEADPWAANAVNGDAVGLIGACAAELGCGVVHFSTDYVFDGESTRAYDEDDVPRPLSVYGASKLYGERLLRSSGARHLLLRTQWLFGAHGKSFPRTMYQRAKGRLPTRVVHDQFGNPTSTVDLARVAWQLVGSEGCYHVVNSGTTSWYELARAVFDSQGVGDLVQPCTSAEYSLPAPRPRRSALSARRVQHAHGVVLPSWRDALARFLSQLETTEVQ